MRLSLKRPCPTPAIRNAGPVLLEKEIACSVSVAVSLPRRYRSTAQRTPSGKPHKAPMANGSMPTKETPNVLRQMASILRFFCAFIVLSANRQVSHSDNIINGNRDGMITRAHKRSASCTPCMIRCEKYKRTGNAKSSNKQQKSEPVTRRCLVFVCVIFCHQPSYSIGNYMKERCFL